MLGDPSRAAGPAARTAGVAVLGLGLALASCGVGGGERESVLLVTVDTLRADRLSCEGYGRRTTPHVDGLAAEGVLFERAYSTAPFTAPSHASLFTSLVTRSHGVTTWGKQLDGEIPSLFRIYTDAGYRTGAFHNHPGLEPSNLTAGADEVQLRYFEPASDTVEAFLAWAERSERPFAAWVHLWDAHRPYGYRDWSDGVLSRFVQRPPFAYNEQAFGEPWDPRVGRDESFYNLNAKRLAMSKRTGTGPRRLTDRDLRYIADRYDGAVAHADAGVGRLVDGLRAGGWLDRTLLVVTSDHGEALLERSACLFSHDPFLYEETIRVPLVVRFPEGSEAGRRVGAIARGIDVLPTLLDFSDLAAPAGLQGRSLLPLARGEELPAVDVLAQTQTRNAKETQERAEEPVLEFRRALVSGRHKLIHDLSADTWELYDLEADPDERRSLVGDPASAALLERLRERMRALVESYPERSAGGGTTPEQEALLEATGYAGK